MSHAEATQAYKVIKMAKCWKKDLTTILIDFDQAIESTIAVKAMYTSRQPSRQPL